MNEAAGSALFLSHARFGNQGDKTGIVHQSTYHRGRHFAMRNAGRIVVPRIGSHSDWLFPQSVEFAGTLH
jgi:hypothetical protein